MKVLFVASGNKKGLPSPIVAAQIESLRSLKIQTDVFLITKKGFRGYLGTVFPLMKHLKKNSYDLTHAHYSLSGFVASLAGCRPLVVSLMGSDVKSRAWHHRFINIFNKLCWNQVIVKSDDMKKNLALSDAEVVPNGVNMSIFNPIGQKEAQYELEWEITKKHILFPSDPERLEKNHSLLLEAVNELSFKNIEIHTMVNIPHNKVFFYLNAADVVVLPSLWEGSPNAIKEAMACNCPVVATNVGDVAWLFGDEPGHFLCGFEPEDLAEKIQAAVFFSETVGRTKGRDRIKSLGLDSSQVAEKIITIYEKVMKVAN